MQQRDVSKTDHEQGLYERYRVERIDGRTDEGGGYFVLRTHNLTNDKPEVAALRAYVAAVRGTHPELAADIEKMLPERAPSDGSIREDLLELADSIELNLDRTVEPEAARQNIDLFRQAADQLESSRGQLHHAQAVAETLDSLRPDRLGHGVRSVEDPAVLDRVVAAGVALEVCPGSNVALGVYVDAHEVPLRQLLDAGATVALGADDPVIFGSRLAQQYTTAREVHGIDDAGLAGLALGSLRASRAPSDVVAAAVADVDAWLRG